MSIAVRWDNDKRLVVATETGGLFRTFDGGTSWQHLDGLPNNKTIDVAFASSAPDIIIATTEPQYRSISDGGIWRSTDGGGSWTQATGWAPPPSLACPSRPAAYGISHMPLSRTFYVGTDCGLAVSNDNGATWSLVVLDSATFSADSALNRIRSVLVINRTSGVLAGALGVWHLDANGRWTKAHTDPTPVSPLPPFHAFAAPWWTGPSFPFFHTTGNQKLWVSSDGGDNWTQITAPSAQLREPFVRVARPLSMDESKIDVYYGDGMKIHRQTFSADGLTGTGSWTNLPSDHDDVSDVAFDLERRIPILLASDGGVHITPDSGAHWKLTGGGFGGFTALQITEVTGQAVSGPHPHQDLYFVSHDNDFKASPDGGVTWPGFICCEGKNLRIAPMGVDHQGSRFTALTCGPCSIFVAGAHLANETSWKSAPDGHPSNRADSPFLIVEDAYLQSVLDTTAPPRRDFFLTLSAGAAWSKSFSITPEIVGPPLFAGSLANPTMYQGVKRQGTLPNGGQRLGLLRVNNIAGSPPVVMAHAPGVVGGGGMLNQPVVSDADLAGIDAIGSLRTTNATVMVVGVDPQNPNHLIAPDVETNEMKFSSDGGANWYPFPALTQAVTDGGKYLFTVAEHSFATVISWDPYDSCHILVGTMQDGILRSTNGGNSWTRIANSPLVTKVSSFYFPPTGNIWVSSDGRGLWTLSLNRNTGSAANGCRFPPRPHVSPPIDSILVLNPTIASARVFRGLGDTAVCSTCSIVVVRNGWVTDLQLSGDTLKRIAISGGTISQIDRAGKETPLAIPNEYRAGEGRLTGRIPGRTLTGSRRARALIVEGTRLKAVIAARGELPFAPKRTPSLFVMNAGKIGVPSIAEPDQPVRVIGTGFIPTSATAQPVRILFGTQIVAPAVPVRADGSFSVELPVPRQPGDVVVTAEQQDGRRLTIEKATVEVATRESPATRQ